MKLISLTKPGIIFGNLITVCGGYFLAAQGDIHFGLLFATLLGISLVIASGCVLNNYIDRDIDKLMERTKNRVLAQGLISGKVAILYGVSLGMLGFLILSLNTNALTVMIASIALFVYVAVYSLWLKRRSTYSTLIGGISGAIPPVIGYCAATNNFNAGAVTLLLMLLLWQMPHAYAIAIYRLKDYSAASIPVLPVKKGIRYTKISMLFYILAFTVAAVMPTLLGYTGLSYFGVACSMGLIWLYLGMKGFNTENNSTWSRKMFLFSIVNITLLSVMMSL